MFHVLYTHCSYVTIIAISSFQVLVFIKEPLVLLIFKRNLKYFSKSLFIQNLFCDPYYIPSFIISKRYASKTFSYLLPSLYQKGQYWILKYFVNKSISKILIKITKHSFGHMWPFYSKIFAFDSQRLKKSLQKLLWNYFRFC